MKRIFDHEKIFGHEKYLDQENMTQCVSAVKRIPYPSLLVDYMNVSNYFYFFKPHIFAALTQSLGVVSLLSPSLSPLLHSALID